MKQSDFDVTKQDLQNVEAMYPFKSSTELVYLLIRQKIVSHSVLPGQRLNQEQIAGALNLSRTPVRDAFNMLEKDGFLSKGAQGYTVYTMRIGDYMALLDLRKALEGLAVKLACSRIRPSELAKLEKNLEESQKYLDQGESCAWDANFEVTDPDKAAELIKQLGNMDRQFHEIIVNSSHNRYIIQSYEDISPQIHFFRHSALDVNAAWNMVVRHRMIYNAILTRDEDEAEAKMLRHLELTINRPMRY